MEPFPTNGLHSAFPGNNVTQQSQMWRPWTGTETTTVAHRIHSVRGDVSDAQSPKTPHVTHPVKLYWPKSKCFDYLYQDAEMLLRSYPVQATICPYQDTSSDEDSEEDEEEEVEKQLN